MSANIKIDLRASETSGSPSSEIPAVSSEPMEFTPARLTDMLPPLKDGKLDCSPEVDNVRMTRAQMLTQYVNERRDSLRDVPLEVQAREAYGETTLVRNLLETQRIVCNPEHRGVLSDFHQADSKDKEGEYENVGMMFVTSSLRLNRANAGISDISPETRKDILPEVRATAQEIMPRFTERLTAHLDKHEPISPAQIDNYEDLLMATGAHRQPEHQALLSRLAERFQKDLVTPGSGEDERKDAQTSLSLVRRIQTERYSFEVR